jgi:T-lymphoma invasion and metastasis-inducing protein 1
MVESSSTLPRYGRRPHHVVSSAIRRRRNKTVHFGDNLLASDFLEPNVQQLFSFIETVLSAWVLDEDGDGDGDDRRRRSSSRSLQQPKRTPSDVVALIGRNLNGDRNIGCPRFKHQHWRIAPDRCNALFLSKVNICLQ